MKKAITYYRVSTDRQGASGLGLEAQRQMVKTFATANEYITTYEFTEIESGRNSKRPILLQALDACKREHATLLIAKLDRLGRNVAFISRLIEAGVDFKAVDHPFASKLFVHIMAAFAEYERDMISERTKAALREAKRRGVVLGKYGRDVLSVVNKQQADVFAAAIQPTIVELQRNGITTVRAITVELNRLNVPTYRVGGHWHVSSVHSVIKRIGQQH